jgi:hypothetical protein
LSFKNYQHPRRAATISVIVAVLLAIGCAYLISDRFRNHQIKTTEQAEHSTTGRVARRAGAQLLADQAEAFGRARYA